MSARPSWRRSTSGPAETEALAEALAHGLRGGEVLALVGELGAGKTCFVRGLARGLGVRDDVSSPTYALVHEYEGARGLTLVHADLYRLGGVAEARSLGLEDWLGRAGTVVVVEWADRAPELFEHGAARIELERTTGDERSIAVAGLPEPT